MAAMERSTWRERAAGQAVVTADRRSFATSPRDRRPMIAALLALDTQLLDGATWLLAVAHDGIGGESNPMAIALYHRGGVELVLAIKVMAAVLLAVLAWRLQGRRWAYVPALIGIVGALTNLIAFA